MELRQLWKIARRRWWLILLPTLAAAVYAGYSYLRTPSPSYFGYRTVIRLTAATPAPERGSGYEDTRYYPWLTSEYVVYGLRDWIQTSSFQEEVSTQLAAEGINIPAGQMQGVFYADTMRSVIALDVSWNDAEQLQAITRASIRVLEERSGEYLPQAQDLKVVAFDQPTIQMVPPPIKDRIEPLIRMGLGLIAGIALAAVGEYLDSSLHERADVEALGLPVLAEIPARRFGRR